MVADSGTHDLVTDKSIEEYFQDSVTSALSNQQIEARDYTVYYIVNLLSSFARSENLYRGGTDGAALTPLAGLYAEAAQSHTAGERNDALQRLGDVALFISGLFSDSLNRRVVDVDYYISMGGGAYGHLSDLMRDTERGRALAETFRELSSKFLGFVDVLGEVGENSHLANDSDVMRLYEVWARTGSRRAARKLRKVGIDPVNSTLKNQH